MKLDNIIYDTNTLGSAIQSDLLKNSPTFNALYPSQTSTELVNVLAGYSTMLQYNLVSAMANCYTDTAYSPTGIYQLAETLGNRLHGNISSQLQCRIERTTLTGVANTVIPAGSVFNVEGINFFNKEDIVFSRNRNFESDVTLIQGTKNVTEKIASGIAGERFYFSENFECNTNEVSVTVDGQYWTIVESFIPLTTVGVKDPRKVQCFVLGTDPDGRSYIKCGSGANAIIPAAGSLISINWISNNGAEGNITKSNAEISLITPIYGINNENERELLEVSISESTPAVGGFNTQSLDVLKESSPYIFASGDRAVRRSDYKALLLNKCGYQTCNVWGEYEQATMNGTYDKIMMNMVYYSGIKTIQKYDLQHVSNPEFDLAIVNSNLDETKNFYTLSGQPTPVRGFLGSYEIELLSYDDNNNQISFKYLDKYGTGILTCDYEDNKSIINDTISYEENYLQDDLGPDIKQDVAHTYPVNNAVKLQPIHEYATPVKFEIHNQALNTYIDPDSGDVKTESYSDVVVDLFRTGYKKTNRYEASKCYQFSGKVGDGISSLLLPSNPIQLLFTYTNKREIDPDPSAPDYNTHQNVVNGGVITGFAFKTPGEDRYLKNFIGSFAIYGSTQTVLSRDVNTDYINIKNDSNWVKLTDTITITSELSTDQWTEWFTLDVFDTDTGIWNEYNQYLIEIYSFRDNESEEIYAGRRLAISEIVALYGNQTVIKEVRDVEDLPADLQPGAQISLTEIPGRSSYIYYAYNNKITLNIPFNQTTQKLALPDNINYYEYYVVVEGLTASNGYKTGDILTYIEPYSNYRFNIKVLDNTTGMYNITIEKQLGYPSSVLKGKKKISIIDEEIIDPNILGTGAKINISSNSCVTLYANYLGNFYSNADIQRSDIPTIEKYNHFTTFLEFKQPRVKNIYVDLSVEFENVVTASEVKNNIIRVVNKLFDITPYYLGKTFSVSDLWKAVSLVEGVKRLIVNAPTDNITALPYELISLPSTNLTIRDISEYNKSSIRIKD